MKTKSFGKVTALFLLCIGLVRECAGGVSRIGKVVNQEKVPIQAIARTAHVISKAKNQEQSHKPSVQSTSCNKQNFVFRIDSIDTFKNQETLSPKQIVTESDLKGVNKSFLNEQKRLEGMLMQTHSTLEKQRVQSELIRSVSPVPQRTNQILPNSKYQQSSTVNYRINREDNQVSSSYFGTGSNWESSVKLIK